MTFALLALLAATDAPVLAAAQQTPTEAPAPFECPASGRVEGDAPPDYHRAPDARCVAEGSMAVLYGPDGMPLSRMTRVGPGWYLTAEGYRLADDAFRRVQRERDECRAQAAQLVPTPGVPVTPIVISKGSGWPTGVVVGAAVVGVLAGGYLGCRVGGGCK